MWPPSPNSTFVHLAAADNPRRRTHPEGELPPGLLLALDASAAIPLKIAETPEPVSWRGNRAPVLPPPPAVDFRGGLTYRAPRELPPRHNVVAGFRTLKPPLPTPTALLARDETAVAEPAWRDLTAITASTARGPGAPTLQPPHQLLAAHAPVGTHAPAAPRSVDAARRALTRRVLERGRVDSPPRHRWGTYRSLAITVSDGRPR